MSARVRQTPEARNESVRRSRQKHPEREWARKQVSNAIRSGRLVRPSICEHCGETCFPQASHDDYARPLDVEWLCRPCHEIKDLKTHCVNGHEFTPENTRYTPDDWRGRECLACRRERDNASKGTRLSCDTCGKEMRRDSLRRHAKEVHG